MRTPQRCGVLFAKVFAQELGIPILQALVQKVTSVTEHVQRQILASKQTHSLHNQLDHAPDPQGRKRVLTRSDTAAISEYLNDDLVPLDDRGKPWVDIVEDAGVMLPCTIQPQTIQHACKHNEDIINALCMEEWELTMNQAIARLAWIDIQLLQ